MVLSPRQREWISRATMLIVLGILPILGGIKCIHAARALADDFEKRREAYPAYDWDKDSSGSFLPYLLAGVLTVPGVFFTVAAVLPTATLAKVIGPQRQNRLWDNPTDPRSPYGRHIV